MDLPTTKKKDNFLLKKADREVFEALTDADAGKLIKGIFSYACTGESGLNGILNAIFIPIKKSIDENEKKYQSICERNKKNGANGGRPNEEKKETQNNPVGLFGSNTHISYITNKNLEKIGHGEEKPLKADDSNLLLETTKKVVSYLNKKTGSNFKYGSKATQSKINARLNEKYSFDDFIAVIDKKCDDWIGTEFEKYLCPETLFGTKFEKYLNQKTTKKNTTHENKPEPNWLDKTIEKETVSEKEAEELRKLLGK